MKNNSRTENAIKNTKITILCHIVFLMCSFVCRTIFTKKLGSEYLGIGGLFSNILTILSFAELGLGSTLVYRLYKPFAENDYNKINLYVRLYKKIYNIIIVIILALGLALIPFLGYLVDAPNVKESLTILYLLYLSQTIASYVFVYKKTLLTADQKDYIVSIFNEIFNLLMNIFQCISLILFEDFTIYLIIAIIFGILNNISCSIYVDRKYKFLKDEVKGKLSKEEIKGLKKDTKGLMMTKVASTAFSGTDNIFISTFVGIKYVGILSNYTLILSTINALMNKVFGSITASIGNLAISKDSSTKSEGVLLKIFFINTSLYGYICIAMTLLIGEFVTNIWLNGEFYLSYSIIVLTIVELFLRSIHYPLYTTRNAFGLFSQHKIIYVFSAVLNIILDFALVIPLGIAGLVIATIICRGITYVTDIYVLYKYGFKSSPINYYKNLLKWAIFIILCYILCYLIISNMAINNIAYFILKIAIITAVYIVLYLIFFIKSDEMKYFVKLIRSKLFKRKKINK